MVFEISTRWLQFFAWFLRRIHVFVIVGECFEMIALTIGCLIFFACFEQFEFGI